MSEPSKPPYVQLGLYGVHRRKTALAYFALSIVLAVGTAVLFPPLWGLIFVGSAIWYGACIRWMDAHDGWEA